MPVVARVRQHDIAQEHRRQRHEVSSPTIGKPRPTQERHRRDGRHIRRMRRQPHHRRRHDDAHE